MNIENDKISGRQLGRMIFYDFFGLTSLALPGYLAKTAGMDGFFCLAAGFGAGYLFLLAVISQMKRMGKGYQPYLRERFGTVLTAAVLLCYFFIALFGAAYGLRLLGDVIRQYLIKDTPMWLVLGVLAVLAAYGLGAGLECRGRLYEALFWFVVLPLVLLFLLAMVSVEPEGWVPVFRADGKGFAAGSYVVFAFLMGSAFLPMLSEGLAEHADTARVLKQSFIFSMCINLVLFLLLAGIFRVPTMAVMEEPALTLTAMVKVPGGFLERQDALLCGIWFVSVFAFVENSLYYLVWCMRKISKKTENGWFLFGAAVLVYALAFAMHRSGEFTDILVHNYLWIAVPVLVFAVLLAGVLPVRGGRKRHIPDAAHRKKRISGTVCRKEGRV